MHEVIAPRGSSHDLRSFGECRIPGGPAWGLDVELR